MAPIPGNSWTERRFGHAVARLRPNHALQGDARVTRGPSATLLNLGPLGTTSPMTCHR